MDRRIGVLGSADEAGRKALFLRTYSRQVMPFEKEKNSEAMRETLSQAGVRRAGKAVRVECLEDGVRVTVEGGDRFDLDVLYPALGCQVRSERTRPIKSRTAWLARSRSSGANVPDVRRFAFGRSPIS
jgi:thioredoxin reductase (NADPH)